MWYKLKYRGVSFKDYVSNSDVKEMSKDIGASRAMFEKALRRLKCVKAHEIDEECATFVFEDIYEAMRECAQSVMFADGYKSTDSHEACVAFINDNYGSIFGDELVFDLDRYRKTRNESRYRFRYVNKDMTEEALKTAEEFVRVTELVLNPKIMKK